MTGRAMTAARDGDELGRPIPAVAAPQPDDVAVFQRDDAGAVMLQLVKSSRRRPGPSRRARAGKAG